MYHHQWQSSLVQYSIVQYSSLVQYSIVSCSIFILYHGHVFYKVIVFPSICFSCRHVAGGIGGWERALFCSILFSNFQCTCSSMQCIRYSSRSSGVCSSHVFSCIKSTVEMEVDEKFSSLDTVIHRVDSKGRFSVYRKIQKGRLYLIPLTAQCK